MERLYLLVLWILRSIVHPLEDLNSELFGFRLIDRCIRYILELNLIFVNVLCSLVSA